MRETGGLCATLEVNRLGRCRAARPGPALLTVNLSESGSALVFGELGGGGGVFGVAARAEGFYFLWVPMLRDFYFVACIIV